MRDVTLSQRSPQGALVRGLQQLLNVVGQPCDVDGDYGRQTAEAVRLWQLAEGLPATGTADPATRARLRQCALDSRPVTPPLLGVDLLSVTQIPAAPIFGSYWPIRTQDKRGRTVSGLQGEGRRTGGSGRAFGDVRGGGRRHVGVDLYGAQWDPVVAIASGVILAARPFYRGTFGLYVYTASEDTTINYGEVMAGSWEAWGLEVGDRVVAGQPIALVGKMTRSSMIHFEAYHGRRSSNQRYFTAAPAPLQLRNPTPLLQALAAHGD